MDNMRGQDEINADDGLNAGEIETPPAIVANERRMHVRAYNYWVSLLGDRALPSIEDLNPEELEDFSANSVLLDFSMGLDNPAIIYLGSALRDECDITGAIERVDQVPARSLLTRLTDHYLQIIANAAPVGFEAEFTNQRDVEIMYRGILMPFSSDDETIDFIYGVISWKEKAPQTLVQEINGEIEDAVVSAPAASVATPIWADGPSATADFPDSEELGLSENAKIDEIVDFGFDEIGDAGDLPGSDDLLELTEESVVPESGSRFYDTTGPVADDDGPGDEVSATGDEIAAEEAVYEELPPLQGDPVPEATADEELDLAAFMDELELDEASSVLDLDGSEIVAGDAGEVEDALDVMSGIDDFLPDGPAEAHADQEDEGLELVPQADESAADLELVASLDTVAADEGDLASVLDVARQGALEARDTDARSRTALYRAIGLAYDFALSARTAPEDYEVMLEKSGITAQERSPMTAVVKLVFGADYEKTRVAEYALALEYAQAQDLPRGALARQLGFYEGGLKGLVRDMRDMRRAEGTAPSSPAVRRLDRAVRKLNKASPAEAADLPFGDLGLAVVVARREEDGSISLVAGVGLDDKAAQKVMITASKSI